MRCLAVLVASLAIAAFAGCARHVVIERDMDRMDGATSVGSDSDTSWTVSREPEAGDRSAP